MEPNEFEKTPKGMTLGEQLVIGIVLLLCFLALSWAACGCRTCNIGCTVAEVSAPGCTEHQLGHAPAGYTELVLGVPRISITQTALDARATVTQGKETPIDMLRGLGQGATVPVGQTASATVSGATNTQTSSTEREATKAVRPATGCSAVTSPTANPTTTEKGVQSVPASAPAG